MTQLVTQEGLVRIPAGTWKVYPAHSSVAFEVKHLMISTVRGHFREFDGMLEAAEDDAANSRAWGTVEAASIDTGNLGLPWTLAAGGLLGGEKVKVPLGISALRASDDR
jgi:polyisoprenoid-binding protein YceI